MNQESSSCPSADQLHELLKENIAEHLQQPLQDHVAECQACQTKLEQTAADDLTWEEAHSLLEDWKVHPDLEADELRFGEPADEPSLQLKSVIDALAPTDDPNMLGRLGGYEVSGVVGTGGMGIVLKAHDGSLDRIVAIKVMAPHLATSGPARRRFSREAKAAAAILHPNVIAIHSVSNSGALPYLVMSYVRGDSLQKRIFREGPLPLVDILRIASQIAAGLSAAHEQGLVHRDIKPANILLEEGVERVAITDFGLARAVDDASMTRSGLLAGTPQFMSPEQGRGSPVDSRSDLFSLGSVLYAMCTGRPPFRAETSYGVLHRVAHESPRPIREINPKIPAWLCKLIEGLHQKSADERPASANEVEQLLHECIAHVEQPDKHDVPLSLRDSSKVTWKGLLVPALGTSLIVVASWIALAWQSPAFQRNVFQNPVLQRPSEDNSKRALPLDDRAKSSDLLAKKNTTSSLPDADAAGVSPVEWPDDLQPSIDEITLEAIQLEFQTRIPFDDGASDAKEGLAPP